MLVLRLPSRATEHLQRSAAEHRCISASLLNRVKMPSQARGALGVNAEPAAKCCQAEILVALHPFKSPRPNHGDSAPHRAV